VTLAEKAAKYRAQRVRTDSYRVDLNRAIKEAKSSMTLQQIAVETGFSKARVAQIVGDKKVSGDSWWKGKAARLSRELETR
jgi:hypothetical protein